MTHALRIATLTFGVTAAILLGKTLQDGLTPGSGGSQLVQQQHGEIFLQAIEYRTPTKTEVPLSSGTENHVVYTVPAKTRIIIKSYMLPLGVPANGGKLIAPLGLGLQVDDRTIVPKTVHVNNDWEQIITMDPGIEFTSGNKIVVRFGETIKGLSGNLFLNGVIE
ncbi:MAG: hypothetical protein ACKVS6_04270 [Planctomycetota bacterium]